MMPPVSVCHQVSTMGHLPCPMAEWYQRQASGLIGSPTLPSSRRDAKLCFSGNCKIQTRQESHLFALLICETLKCFLQESARVFG